MGAEAVRRIDDSGEHQCRLTLVLKRPGHVAASFARGPKAVVRQRHWISQQWNRIASFLIVRR